MNSYKGYKDLDCYKYARELRKSISLLAKIFPKHEKYELAAQIISATRSITANIAEGYGRFTYTDTRNFFIMSRGSLTETLEHLTTAFDEGYITEEQLRSSAQNCETVFKLLNGYISYLDRSKKQKS